MNYKVVSQKDIINNSHLFNGEINITDFEESRKFKLYKEEFIKHLIIIMDKYSVSSIARKMLMARYMERSQIIQLRSKGCILNYYWPNGELKSLVLLDRYLVTEQPQWLKHYPFIDLTNKKDGNFISINDQYYKRATIYKFKEDKSCIITHNNHFGHFLFDDFPRIIMDNLQFESYVCSSVNPIQLSRGIEDIMKNFIRSRRVNNTQQLSEHSIVKANHLLTSIITNPVVNSYIIMQLFERYRKHLTEDLSKPKKIYLERASKYQSRIRNQEEVKQTLKTNSFVSYDPSKYSTIELISLLSNASVIVTEAGTSCLVSSLYAPLKCKIVTLVPEDLLRNPDLEMILSGLPYHFANPFNTEFILGRTASDHRIQSSKECIYSIQELNEQIKD